MTTLLEEFTVSWFGRVGSVDTVVSVTVNDKAVDVLLIVNLVEFATYKIKYRCSLAIPPNVVPVKIIGFPIINPVVDATVIKLLTDFVEVIVVDVIEAASVILVKSTTWLI